MDIKQIIEEHALWLATDGEEGFCANLEDANLVHANLVRANLESANLAYDDLARANLAYANLSYADLGHANMSYADLVRANLSYANLARANLAYANLEGVNLEGANLAYVNLESANLAYADLTYADLAYANLEGANLEGTIGNLDHLKSIFCDTHHVTYTAEVMQIGCERHKIEDWWSFGDDLIISVDGKEALKWWKTWKPLLQQIITASPAIVTGYVKQVNKKTIS